MIDFDQPHLRTNILTGEKVLVSPHRNKRPWQGQFEDNHEETRPDHDPSCYLCPGNERASGYVNPSYKNQYVFKNDFSALLSDTEENHFNAANILQAETERGLCKVVIFSPKHNLTLPELSNEDLIGVINTWQQEFEELQKTKWIKYIQIFENKGSIMGCSNPHPHGQIWAQKSVPTEITKESIQFSKHFKATGRSILSDYIAVELAENKRIIIDNDHFLVVVPFWASWPYETLIVSKRQIQYITQFTEDEKIALAATLKELTTRYDNIFKTSFPYSAGIHQAPVNDGEHPEWHWHMHFYPPLLRSATIKKFMVGYEMLANPQRDITPEQAAQTLANQPIQHYKTFN